MFYEIKSQYSVNIALITTLNYREEMTFFIRDDAKEIELEIFCCLMQLYRNLIKQSEEKFIDANFVRKFTQDQFEKINLPCRKIFETLKTYSTIIIHNNNLVLNVSK